MSKWSAEEIDAMTPAIREEIQAKEVDWFYARRARRRYAEARRTPWPIVFNELRNCQTCGLLFTARAGNQRWCGLCATNRQRAGDAARHAAHKAASTRTGTAPVAVG